MRSEQTVEVNPNELSQEVRDELIEKGELTESEADQYANEAHLKQIQTAQPEKSNVVESSILKYKSFKRYINNRRKKATKNYHNEKATADIKDVSATDDNKIKITLNHAKLGESEIVFDENSTAVANLISYYNVENPLGLIGKSVVIDRIYYLGDPEKRSPTYLFPNNVSILGKLRYKIFSTIQNIRGISSVWLDGEVIPGYLTTTLASMLVSLCVLCVWLIGSSLTEVKHPIVSQIGQVIELANFIGLFIVLCISFWLISRFLLFIGYWILKGDFYEE